MGLNTVGAQLGLQQMMELMKKMKNTTQRVVQKNPNQIPITSASRNGLHVIMLEKQMHASYLDAMAVVRHGKHPDLFINASHFGRCCTQRELKQHVLKPTPVVLDDCLIVIKIISKTKFPSSIRSVQLNSNPNPDFRRFIQQILEHQNPDKLAKPQSKTTFNSI